MSSFFDLETDLRYKQGKKVGYKIGFKKGKAIGKAIVKASGKLGGKAEFAEIATTNMLQSKLFTLPEIAELLTVELDFVQKIEDKLDQPTVPASKPNARKPRPKKKD